MLFFRQTVAPCSNSNAAPLFVCFSVGLSFCGTDIFLIFSNGCNGCLNAAGDVLQIHGRCRGRSSNYLFRNERNVHKPPRTPGYSVARV